MTILSHFPMISDRFSQPASVVMPPLPPVRIPARPPPARSEAEELGGVRLAPLSGPHRCRLP
ncbi:hypothetical protein T261_8318 [Streptomyces lydicus]|nr:hypothetical protein T261_8318 [Streptomyces lydicus]